MQEQLIECPFCKEKFPLTEAISHRLRESLRDEVEKKVEREYTGRLEKDIEKIKSSAGQKVREELALELADLRERLDEKAKQLKDSQEAELELRKRERSVEEKERNFDLEMARRLAELTKAEREMLEQQHGLEMRKKEKLIDDLKNQLDEAMKKAEQGSQQLQGDVLEVDLEAILKDAFPADRIKRVPKGWKGADILQAVFSESGLSCGTLIWEAKHTKRWSKGWIEKLKDDQTRAKADIAIIATEALPEEIKRFGLLDRVWVCHYERDTVIGLAVALRTTLLEVSRERRMAVGKDKKMENLYRYLTGNEFRQRVQSIVEAFISMKEDLESEKRVFKKHWAKREKQIERVIDNIAAMHGELEGIGASLPQIASLELKALTASSDSEADES